MTFESRDPAYPELTKSHTMARKGRPWTDYKPPSAAPFWAAIEGLGRYCILLAALDLDVFDTLNGWGRRRPRDWRRAGRTGRSPAFVARCVVVQGLLDQFVDVYELNDTAKRYLVTDGPASMAGLIPVAPGPHDNWARLAETVRRGWPATPIEDGPAAFYVPLVEGTFTTMFRCASGADLKIRYSALTAPQVLDLGQEGRHGRLPS